MLPHTLNPMAPSPLVGLAATQQRVPYQTTTTTESVSTTRAPAPVFTKRSIRRLSKQSSSNAPPVYRAPPLAAQYAPPVVTQAQTTVLSRAAEGTVPYYTSGVQSTTMQTSPLSQRLSHTHPTSYYAPPSTTDVTSALHASTAGGPAIKVGPHQSANLLGARPQVAGSTVYNQYATSAYLSPPEYSQKYSTITTATTGHMKPSESPLAFTTVTYAKNSSSQEAASLTEAMNRRASAPSNPGNSGHHSWRHKQGKFVKKQRGYCAGCNESASTAFDSNGGGCGWLNCGCCDRPQLVPVAIDYSPQAY